VDEPPTVVSTADTVIFGVATVAFRSSAATRTGRRGAPDEIIPRLFDCCAAHGADALPIPLSLDLGIGAADEKLDVGVTD